MKWIMILYLLNPTNNGVLTVRGETFNSQWICQNWAQTKVISIRQIFYGYFDNVYIRITCEKETTNN